VIGGSALAGLLLQVALPSAARPAVVAVGVIYFAVVAGISVWAARRTRTASDFFVGGKGIGLIALTVASVSVSVSGFAFIGGPGFIFRQLLPTSWVPGFWQNECDCSAKPEI